MEKTSQQAYKEFMKTFESLSYKHSYSDTFSNFLDFALYLLTPVKTEEEHKTMQRLESTYTEKREAEQMSSLFLNFCAASDDDGNGFHDVLGDLFMDLVSHGRNGQFFTPQHVCDMMAQMQYGSDLRPGKTVCDPACGSGRMLLAMAKLERRLKFYGADNDATCAKMAVLNMIVNSMEGEVAWMNTLTMEHNRSWHIKLILNGTHYLPYLFTSGKNETHFIQRMEMVKTPAGKELPVQAPKPKQQIVQLQIF